MTGLILYSLRLFSLFSRNILGCINNPYITYRKLAEEKTDARQVVFIYLITLVYFFFTSLIRTGLHNPYILTIKLNLLLTGGFLGAGFMIFLLYVLGNFMRRQITIKTLIVLWSYTLLPTLLWFFFTSMMYLIIPPPRTLSIFGKLYSVVFIAFSLGVFAWKLILYYLTLRFGLRLGFFRISITTLILTPFIIGYSIIMYRLGIFRIPFI